MSDLLLLAAVVLALVNLALLFVFGRKDSSARFDSRFDELGRAAERTERELRGELARGRDEASSAARQGREELANGQRDLRDAVLSQLKALSEIQDERLAAFAKAIGEFRESVERRLVDGSKLQTDQLEAFSRRLGDLSKTMEERFEVIRGVVDENLRRLQTDNAEKLEKIRVTVDEQLQSTLEKRLNESFTLVSERLEKVHQGLGEMQALASGVGDLKKVLTNVKQRGTWGEYQLGALLEQYLAPGQYELNVATVSGSTSRVEFAVKLPGRDEGKCVWLPIDSKFPIEDYQRLVEAEHAGDVPGLEEAGKALELRVVSQAKEIRDKYVSPPDTTDFGILFLPVESLYAEVLRRPALFEKIQRDFGVTVTGPTTLTAFLSSLQMGFRTLTIEKRSSEIREMLGAAKTEMKSFADQIDKVKKKLQEAANSVDDMGRRGRAVERKLKGVDALPESEASRVLALEGAAVASDDESAE